MNRCISKLSGERGIELGKYRSIWKTKLGLKLIGCLVLSFAISVAFYWVADYIGYYYISHYLDTANHEKDKTDKLMARFQKFVRDNKLTIYDTDLIYEWIDKQKNFDIYCSGETEVIEKLYQQQEAYEGSIVSGTLFDYGLNSYKIVFADATVYCYPICYDNNNYYTIKFGVVLSLTLICFLGWFLMFIRRRIFYISQLANDMKILKSGNLNYQISLPGNDELAYLAKSIDEMRLSVIQKMENESKAIRANHELITAMSHDLRTPLTKQIGYLDIVEYGKYSGEEQLKDYIHRARNNAYQIKDISDCLFRYFLAFDMQKGEKKAEVLKGDESINQILTEQIYYLESQGYQVKTELFSQNYKIYINAQELYRIFDNMFSNIKKYAEKRCPIYVDCKLINESAIVEIKNTIRRHQKKVESTKIGHKIAEKLLEEVGGSFIIEKSHNHYLVKIIIPIYEVKAGF